MAVTEVTEVVEAGEGVAAVEDAVVDGDRHVRLVFAFPPKDMYQYVHEALVLVW